MLGHIGVCKHVAAGQPPEILMGSSEGTDCAICYECGYKLGSVPDEEILSAIPNAAAEKMNIPTRLPGPRGCWEFHADEVV